NTGVSGGEFNIRNSGLNEFVPKVAMNRTGGSFVVTYDTATTTGGSVDVGVDEINANNTNRAHFSIAGQVREPALSIDASGNYFVTFPAGPTGDPDIHGRRGLLS